MKRVINQTLRSFELGSQENTNVPIWITVGLYQKERKGSQNLSNETFFRLPITSAQCIVGTEKKL